jgi:hypothetical protein
VISGEPASLARSQGFTWGPRLFSVVAASTGGVVAAAREAGISGSLSSGLHHARRGRGCCMTFGETMAGVVDKGELERMIAMAFVTAIKEGTTPD